MTDDESESWSNSKGTQLRGIGRSERDVVGLQEIEPRVRFLILQCFMYMYAAALKLRSNSVSYKETLVQRS